MKTIKNKILTSIILNIFLALSILFGVKYDRGVNASEPTPYITIHSYDAQSTTSSTYETKDEKNNIAFIADEVTNYIRITITAYNVENNDITIKYYAEDVTAIAEAGDYYLVNSSITSSSTTEEKASITHELSTIVFSSTKTTATITYEIKKQGIGATINNQSVYRYFNFRIADITGGKIENNQYTYVCYGRNEISIDCISGSDGYYLAPYDVTWEKKYSTKHWDNGSGDQTFCFNLLYDTYTSQNIKVDRSTVLDYILKGEYAQIYTSMFIWADASISNWDYLYFHTYADNSGKTDEDDTKIGYWAEKWVWNDSHYSDVKTKYSYGNYAILDPSWGDAIRVVGQNKCDVYDRWGKFTYTSMLVDDDYAIVNGTYIDASSFLIDGTIRLIIRFNELVQVAAPSQLSVIAQINSSKNLKFEYESGNYTDTLCFKIKASDCGLDTYDKLIKKIVITDIENFSSICDFGKNEGRKNNYMEDYDFDKILGDYYNVSCDIDLRLPSISSATTVNPTASTKSRSVDLNIGNFSKATLYYTWSTDVNKTFESVKSYESSMEIVGDDNSSTKKTISLSDVTGEYYLHIAIQNIYGKISTFIIGSSGVLKNKTEHGYSLDNTSPTIISNNLYKDSLTSKVFDIRVDDGSEYYDSGIETIYISIKTSNNSQTFTDKAIYSTNENINKTIPDDILIGDRADVYYIPETLKNVTYQNKSNPSYFGSTSPNFIVFSSKDKAYEYFYDNELQDFYTILLTSTDTEQIIKIQNARAKGETHIPQAGDVWIRYKVSNFEFDGKYSESDWAYYYYSGTNENEIDITTALQNKYLRTALENVAKMLANAGETKNLYTLNECIDINNLPDIPYANMRYSETFSETLYGASFSDAITYQDSQMLIDKCGGHLSVKIDYNTEIIGCPIDGYVDLWIGFYTVDASGNTTRSSMVYTKYRYDNRILFDCLVQTNDQKKMDDIDEIMVYNINSTFNFSYEIDDTKGNVGDLFIKSIEAYVEDEGIVRVLSSTEYEDYFVITSEKIDQTAYINSINIKNKKCGYAKIEVALKYLETEKRHDPYEFYFTDNFTDSTTNYERSLQNRIVVNSLYKLSEQYTYMTKDRVIKKVSYGDSDTGNAYFSSLDSLQEYVRYMELQDLQLVILTGTMAESLISGGVGTYTKADGEVNIPAAGQTWIRYKISSWTSESTENAWVYYFYNITSVGTIQTNKISGTILDSAINTIVSSIVSKATKVDLVNGSYIDEYGSPTLLEDEIHPNALSTNKTMSDSLFSSNIQYSGDEKLFDSTFKIIIDGVLKEIPVLTNLSLLKEDKTHIFYAYYNGEAIDTLTYSELDYTEGKTYREAIGGANGAYIIREVSISGICDYMVYLDNLAPTLYIRFTSPNSTVNNSRELNSESNGYEFGCKTFTIGSISVNELDTYSYVVVYDEYYKVSKVLYMKDLASNDYTLPNGSWTIVVSDRSGNSYTFKVMASTSKLTLDVSIDESNDYVKVEINREPNEIYRYQVYLNGTDTPIDDTWNASSTTSKRYKESGVYYIYVQDIYGYVLEEKGDSGGGLSFERTAPTVIWSYLDYDNTTYTPYKESLENSPMSMYKSLGNTYYISTSRPVKIKMSDSYKYEITGLDLETDVNYPTAKDITFCSVEDFLKTRSLKDFSIVLWYDDYPDIKVTYNVTCDTDSPDILLTYNTINWDNTDNIEAFNLQDKVINGYVYTPDHIDYTKSSEIINSIADGSIINSNLITLNIEDLSGVKKCLVYLTAPLMSEELLMEIAPTYGKIENVSLSRYGVYRIVAYDIFDNIDEITFTNTDDERINYLVDEETKGQRDEDIIYGNDSSTIQLLEDGLVSIEALVNGETYIYFINCVDGIAYLQEYRCETIIDDDDITYRVVSLKNKQELVLNASGIYENQDVELFSYKDPAYTTANTLYKVLSKYDGNGNKVNPFSLYISYNNNYLLTFKIICEDEDITIKYRVNFDYTFEPYLLESHLSKKLSEITLLNEESEKIDINNEKLSYSNSTFKISENLDEEIVKIEMSYSDVKDFIEYVTIYPSAKNSKNEKNVLDAFDTSKNGFYSIRVYNKYGNVNIFTLNKSDIFQVVYVANYEDGDYTKLSKNYEGIIKSNYSVSIEGYSDSVEFKVTKNNALTTTRKGDKKNGYYQLTLTEEGSYNVKVIDLIYGNYSIVNIEIKNSKLVYDEGLITNYNPDALKLSEGYTNRLLTIEKDKVLDLGIKYIEINYNGEAHILYNMINGELIGLNEESLESSIGSFGDGDYTVIFKDEFGSKVTKEIHYKSTPTLTISRKTTSSTEDEVLEINEETLKSGFWSNDTFTFTTTSSLYKFSFNEVFDECPKTLGFAGTGNGTIPYEIYYQDEYGFKLEFTATLNRKDISIDLDESISTVMVNQILNTRDPIFLTFSDGTCSYTLNGGASIKYNSGDVLYQDGAYRFYCFDKSGNSESLVIIKDSTCEYDFVINGDQASIIDGQAFNANYVTLVSEDNVKITKYYIDGVKQSDLELESFKKGGHYYVFLEDSIGNSSVIEFYMITHSLSCFTYQTPNTYFITEMWFSGNDGTLINYLSTGKITALDDASLLDNINEDGDYQVVMTSSVYKNGLSFSFTIDTTAPDVSLTGTDGVTKTIEDVTLEGCSEGDIIAVYKDNVLISTTEVTYNSDPLTITDGGKYKIIVTNEAGNQTVLTFEKIKILNTSASILVIIGLMAGVIAIVIGAALKNKQKFDE